MVDVEMNFIDVSNSEKDNGVDKIGQQMDI
jgi:hypothetical protein